MNIHLEPPEGFTTEGTEITEEKNRIRMFKRKGRKKEMEFVGAGLQPARFGDLVIRTLRVLPLR